MNWIANPATNTTQHLDEVLKRGGARITDPLVGSSLLQANSLQGHKNIKYPNEDKRHPLINMGNEQIGRR